MQDLKVEAQRQATSQRIQEVGDYLEKLSADIDVMFKRREDAHRIYLMAWFSWTTVVFTRIPFVDDLFMIIFILTLVYDFYRTLIVTRAVGEYIGAIKVLEILGFIPPDQNDGIQKKIRVWSEMTETVKGWFTSKKTAQEKVYAPA